LILSNKEKKRLVDTLSWMTVDMKYKHDETHQNQEYGSQGYSPELTSAIELLDNIKKTETIEITGCHRQLVALNCRDFDCRFSRQGICISSKVTLEKIETPIVGMLKCVEAEEKEIEESDNGII